MKLEGADKLERRLKAIRDSPRGLLREVQIRAVAEAKVRVPRRTGDLGRSIVPGTLGRDFAIVRARKRYAVYVEYGTRAHVIRPKRAKVLAWPADPGGARLSGRARRGAKMRFARVVHHPGTKAHPYLVPGAIAALRSVGLKVRVIDHWNRAA